MLETHTLKQHLDQTRQELSQALYQVRLRVLDVIILSPALLRAFSTIFL